MKFSVVGDPGQTSNSANTFDHMLAEVPRAHAAVIVGDLSYADRDEPRWE